MFCSYRGNRKYPPSLTFSFHILFIFLSTLTHPKAQTLSCLLACLLFGTSKIMNTYKPVFVFLGNQDNWGTKGVKAHGQISKPGIYQVLVRSEVCAKQQVMVNKYFPSSSLPTLLDMIRVLWYSVLFDLDFSICIHLKKKHQVSCISNSRGCIEIIGVNEKWSSCISSWDKLHWKR